MHFYLSSYRLCKTPMTFAGAFRRNKKVAIISNALDFSSDKAWIAERHAREIADLSAIGLEGKILDLRFFFGKSEALQKELSEYGGFWVTGGNAFVLRNALHLSGFDRLLLRMIPENLVYGGYSAGVCVLSPSLDGIHLVDDPEIVPADYQGENRRDGLGILKYHVAPHYASDHHESHLIEQTVKYYIEHKMLFIALKDGESISFEINAI